MVRRDTHRLASLSSRVRSGGKSAPNLSATATDPSELEEQMLEKQRLEGRDTGAETRGAKPLERDPGVET